MDGFFSVLVLPFVIVYVGFGMLVGAKLWEKWGTWIGAALGALWAYLFYTAIPLLNADRPPALLVNLWGVSVISFPLISGAFGYLVSMKLFKSLAGRIIGGVISGLASLPVVGIWMFAII